MNNYKKSLLALSLTLGLSSSLMAETFSFDTQPIDASTLVMFQTANNAAYSLDQLPQATQVQLAKAMAAAKFNGDQGQTLELLAPVAIEADRIIVLGLGEQPLRVGEIQALGGQLASKLAPLPEHQVQVFVDPMPSEAQFAANFAHGSELASYRFERYKQFELAPKHYHFVSDDTEANVLHKQLQAVESGVFLARDMTNTTAGDLYPDSFAREAKKLSDLGVKVTVLDEKALAKLNMGAILGVGKGSDRGPRLVVAHWQGSQDAPVALVGKGITFDSGGYNIKATGTSIAHMKSDMAGAATVLATVKAMAMQQAAVNVVAIMPLAENMISGDALRPGDVLTTAAGKTVEVMNTDAEGRLILADALWYAQEKYQPRLIVDVATLTGSKVRALGREFAGIFSDSDTLVTEFTYAGQQVGERLWRLPLDKAYGEELKSPIADLKNTGTQGSAGASSAAMFLKAFINDDQPWVHLDIAGNALSAKPSAVAPAGATGYGVRLLSYWLTQQP
ncbi:leucyl aminopeptidase [Shewanella sp. NIFS-20-20]|uniref:leucyl aminopeptidase n=1 Tax=Shewanella sp. NIFS-20-20 TaxID=2853806 RepID=UPI001C46FEF4|nr:leucyl aminopeptidase [Shewanella sp. NIFS-20-20]MBV7316519.1 leucyl aminopeptidase [Shewanella sp. NIFS-20-20]